MQDKYVGDIGDYGKLALLRAIAGTTLRLGIVWCATSGDAKPNNHGSLRQYRKYTGKHCLRHCDPALFDAFAIFDDAGSHKIKSLEPLTGAERFFGELLQNVDRKTWTENALQSMSNMDVVFFDPDNGVTENSNPSPKHISIKELQQHWIKGQSLLIYHHLSRKKGGHEQDVEELRRKLGDHFPHATISPLRFKRGTSRAYFLVCQPNHLHQLHSAIQNPAWLALTMSKEQWAKNFHPVR